MRSRTGSRWASRAVSALLLCAALSGCTLVKPVVGTVTGPFLLMGSGGGRGSWGDGRGSACILLVLCGIGAGSGLVTGVISDVQVLTGTAAEDPAANWWNPYLTNTSE